ncbi:hypothetical protein [Allosphingosinicella sp.]|jgi:hypothetical protein|uniref:hypothetical protein n=1 Tax=Allosphingosinicella sp. TaxID=2823234 RepID=UPI002EE2C5C4
MSGGADFDLSGRWNGIFNYPGPFPPVAFEAELRDQDGSITGMISEPDESPRGTAGTLHSIVDGSREGRSVSFSKMYEDEERMPEPVFYGGTVQPDGNEISGRWEIPGHWSGTFLMVRDPGAAETAAEEVAEEVPVEAEARPL